MTYRVEVDHAQTRLARSRVHVVATGEELDEGYNSDTWILPNNTIMLWPTCFDSAWSTSNVGDYAKLALSQMTVISGSWVETEISPVAAGTWLTLSPNTSGGGELRTTATYSKNRGLVLQCYNYGNDKSTYDDPLITVGWGNSKASSNLYMDLYPDGKAEIWRNGVLVSRESITSAKAKQSSKQAGEFFELVIVPQNHNELFVWSNNGGSYSTYFPDILPTNSSPTVCPSGSLFVKTYPDQSAKILLAPIVFKTSGTILSEKMNFVSAPVTSGTLESWVNESWIGTENYRVYGYPAYVGTQDCVLYARDWTDNAFTPNSSNTEVRLKFALTTSNSGYSPTIAGGQIAYQGALGTTASSLVDITQYCSEVNFNVPDQGAQTIRFTVVEAASAITAVPNLDSQLYRPIRLRNDNHVLFDGVITKVTARYEDGWQRLDIEASDKTALMDRYLFRERVPLAGEYLTGVISFISGICGHGASNPALLSTSTYKLPFINSKDNKLDDWGKFIDVGDNATNVLRETLESFAATWVYGFAPTSSGDTRLFAYAPTDLPSGVSYTLYPDTATALSVGGSGGKVWEELKWDTIAPECNEVRVTGYDPKTQRGIQAFKRDIPSSTVTTTASARPDNWLGFESYYGLTDPAFTTIDDLEYACELLFDRLCTTRVLAEIDAEWIIKSNTLPLWIGDRLLLYGVGYFRVIAIECVFEKETTQGSVRPAKYTLELLEYV